MLDKKKGMKGKFFVLWHEWVYDPGGVCERWAFRLYVKGKSPKKAGKIIKRAFYLYCLGKPFHSNKYFCDFHLN